MDKTISLKLLEAENESLDIVDQQTHDQSGHETSQVEATPSNNEAVRRSTRKIKAPIRYNDYGLMTQIMSVDEPQNFEEAKNHKEWMNAMYEEYVSIMNNETWELTKLPENKFSISCKWLFKIKFNADGTIDKIQS